MAERIIERLIRQQVDINDIQFGFMTRCGTTNAILILRQLKEKYSAKSKNASFTFVDSEKDFEILGKLGVEERLVKILESIYRNA